MLLEPTPDGSTAPSFAHAKGRIVLRVPAAPAPATPGARNRNALPAPDAEMIRHELAHLCLHRAGIDADDWLHEGVAHEVESMRRLPSGDLVPAAVCSALPEARPAAQTHSLAELLEWSQWSPEGRRSGSAMRALAQTLVRFLLEAEGETSFAVAVRAIGARTHRELLAREPDWRRWLLGGDGE